MKHLLIAALLLGGLTTAAQNTIYSLAIGNWRGGSPVYITPVIETTEAMSKAALEALFRAQHPELKDIAKDNLDVLLFGTREEGDDKRMQLQRSYAYRKLEVMMLEAPAEARPTDGR